MRFGDIFILTLLASSHTVSAFTNGEFSMKKSLMALAILGTLASTASAQSSVTLYGIIDISTQYTTNQTAVGGKKFSMDASSLIPSRWGIRGSETLDGSLKANFRLESSLNIENGTTGTLFDRNATVGLSGSMGSIDFGRQHNLTFDLMQPHLDPMSAAFAGTNPNVAFGTMNNVGLYGAYGASNGFSSPLRQNNSIKYVSPAMEGFTFLGMYGLGEKAGDASAGAFSSAGVGYNKDGVRAAFIYAQLKDANNISTLSSYNGGVSFVVEKKFTFRVSYIENKVNTTKRKISVIGAGMDYAVNPNIILTAAYYNNERSGDVKVKGKADQFVGLARYLFSKRTQVYGALSYAKAGSKLAVDTDLGIFIVAGNQSATRATLGMTHSF